MTLRRGATGALSTMVILAALLPAPCFGFGSSLATCQPPIEPVQLVTPTVISNCTETDIRAALAGGGQIVFDCGSAPVTIPIGAVLELNSAVDTVLDGGGLVTLDGQNISRLFFKGWDPADTQDITITLQNIKVINGRAPAGGNDHSGGAFYGGYQGLRLHIINSTFANNSTADINISDNQGGAVFMHNSYETIISGSEFTNNLAGNGGAFGAIASDLHIFNSRFSGNAAADDSTGGIVKGHGGAIHLDGVGRGDNFDTNRRVHVCGSVFENNSSIRGGGALKVTVSDNRNTLATYEKSSFIGNSASGVTSIEGHGGAIYHIEDDHAGGSSEQNIELLGCLFSGNSGWRQGGGAWFSINGLADVINNTFVDNLVTSGDRGMGGALVVSSGSYSVINNTFARNYAWFHGGALQAPESAAVMLKNNLFYYNESMRVWACYQFNLTGGATNDGGGNMQYPLTRYNQSGSVEDCKVAASAVFANPALIDPADNGGPTWTMALPVGSPAIDTGSNSGSPADDQRGFDRDESCDIGAFEHGAQPEPRLADALLILKICAGLSVDMNELEAIDMSGDQQIGVAEAIGTLRALSQTGP